ncbi:MAG TPA: hypothetical protein VNP72_01090 [Longimicrobium sp.]|nr:hypothetical protein [Longimicrobium sp.]
MRKLKLDIEALQVEQFSTQASPKEQGTVEAHCGTSPGPCWTTCDPYGQNASCWYTCNMYDDTCCHTCCRTCQYSCDYTCGASCYGCASITEAKYVCDCYPPPIEA